MKKVGIVFACLFFSAGIFCGECKKGDTTVMVRGAGVMVRGTGVMVRGAGEPGVPVLSQPQKYEVKDPNVIELRRSPEMGRVQQRLKQQGEALDPVIKKQTN